MSNLILFSFSAPDLMMAGSALFATLCGVILMGGRSVVGWPLRVLSNLFSRRMQREAAVCLNFTAADRTDKHEVRRMQRPLQRVA